MELNYNEKGYIINEDGSIRNCDSNIAKMNLFEIAKVKHIGVDVDWKEYFTALLAVFVIPLYVIFSPVCILCRAYMAKKRSQEKCEKYAQKCAKRSQQP